MSNPELTIAIFYIIIVILVGSTQYLLTKIESLKREIERLKGR